MTYAKGDWFVIGKLINGEGGTDRFSRYYNITL